MSMETNNNPNCIIDCCFYQKFGDKIIQSIYIITQCEILFAYFLIQFWAEVKINGDWRDRLSNNFCGPIFFYIELATSTTSLPLPIYLACRH